MLRRLPNRLGEHPARASGEGIEFAGVREYVPGDRQRSINWPATTRRGRLQVNTFAAERSQDVVLLVDATSDVGEPGTSALDLALRGAAAAARAYLDARDRVGVITYQWGGASWLVPGLGRRQVYRIIDSMLASACATRGCARGASFSRLPRAALPPGALVVVFSPLLDQRFVEALRDMRERGFTMLVVDVLNAEPPRPRALAGRTTTGWPGGSGGWSNRRSGSRCASSASPWCTGTACNPWTCRWPLYPPPPGGPPMRGHRGHPRRRVPARSGLRGVGDRAAGAHGPRGLGAVPGDLGVAAGALRLALTAVPVPETPTCCPRGCAAGSASWRPSAWCPGRKAR